MKGLPFKCDPIGVRLDPMEREALVRIAEAEQRALSALMRKIISDWLAARPTEAVEALRCR